MSIADDAVYEPILAVALRCNFIYDNLIQRRRDVLRARGWIVQQSPIEQRTSHVRRPPRRRPDGDPVERVRVRGDLLQPLPPARRTRSIVRELNTVGVCIILINDILP